MFARQRVYATRLCLRDAEPVSSRVASKTRPAAAGARKLLASLSERKTWRCVAPVNNPILMGVIFYLLILAMIVFGSSAQYRFFYGNF